MPIRPRPNREQAFKEKQAWIEAKKRGENPEPPLSLLEESRVYLGEGLTLPATFGDAFDDSDRGLHVEVECNVVDAKPVCAALTVWRLDGNPLRPADLQHLPLEKYADEAAEGNTYQMPPGTPIGRHVAEIHAPERDPSFRRRSAITDNDLRRAAAVYRAALANGIHPTAEVARTFEVSRATAGRLIRRARDREFLGPATPRKAGEAGKEQGT
jgi:hypothetical protein